MNIDRLVSLYRAALKANRTFVMDLYTAVVARATSNARIPQANWDQVRVFLPRAQRKRVLDSGRIELIDSVRSCRIYADELKSRRSELLITARPSMLAELRVALDDATAIWSMWGGYLENDPALRSRLAGYGLPVHHVHASGHASRTALIEFATAVQPRVIVPIHTDRAGVYCEAFANVRVERDGSWWLV